MAIASEVAITLDEPANSVHSEVRSTCEILGPDLPDNRQELVIVGNCGWRGQKLL